MGWALRQMRQDKQRFQRRGLGATIRGTPSLHQTAIPNPISELAMQAGQKQRAEQGNSEILKESRDAHLALQYNA